MFYLKSFIVLVLKFRYILDFELVFVCVFVCVLLLRVPLYSFACGFPVVPAPHVKETALFPH